MMLRKKHIKYGILIGSCFIFLLSCRKVIPLKVNDTTPKLVIDAEYNANSETVLVHISKSIPVFSSDSFPKISSASILIKDQSDAITPLINQGDGSYKLTNYSPIYGSEYTLIVHLNGKTYTATDSLVPTVPIDGLPYGKVPDNPIVGDGYMVFAVFTDPPGKNYYRINKKINGEWKTELSDQMITDDAMFSNNTAKVPLFPSIFHIKDTVVIHLLSYSKKSYEYYSALYDVASSTTSSLAPSNPPSFWGGDVLGHFTAYGYDSKQVIIKEN